MTDKFIIAVIMLFSISPAFAALKVIYVGTDSDGRVSRTMVRGIELVVADSLREQGLIAYSGEDVERITHVQITRSDLTGEKNLSYWCRKVHAERGVFAYIKVYKDLYTLQIFVVNPQKERVEFSTRVEFYSAASADEAAQKAAGQISRYLKEKVRPVPGPNREGFIVRSLVPGLAQDYYGYKIKGRVFPTVFGIGLTATGVTFGYYMYKKQAYENYHGGPAYPGDTEYIEKSKDKYNEMEDSFRAFQFCGIATAVFYIYNFIDAYAFSSAPVDYRYKNRPWRPVGLLGNDSMTVSPIFIPQDKYIVPGLSMTFVF